MGKHTKMEVVCQEKNHKKNRKIWERPPHTSECRSGYKLGKEGVLEAEKGISDDCQFKSCIGEKDGLSGTARKGDFTILLYFSYSSLCLCPSPSPKTPP